MAALAGATVGRLKEEEEEAAAVAAEVEDEVEAGELIEQGDASCPRANKLEVVLLLLLLLLVLAMVVESALATTVDTNSAPAPLALWLEFNGVNTLLCLMASVDVLLAPLVAMFILFANTRCCCCCCCWPLVLCQQLVVDVCAGSYSYIMFIWLCCSWCCCC